MSDCPEGQDLTQFTHLSIYSVRKREPGKRYDDVHYSQDLLRSIDPRKTRMRRETWNGCLITPNN